MIRVMVVGSGAREHTLVWACRQSPLPQEVFCAPGNAGTAQLAKNVPLAADDVHGIVKYARDNLVELVVLGPDAAVAAGVADGCAEADIACFGPTKAAGKIEWSKVFAKELMEEAGIPTATWQTFTHTDRGGAEDYIRDMAGRCVVKADGLATGKGVFVCNNVDEGIAALDACFVERHFGAAGDRVIIEERLEGPEISVFALTDGNNVRMLPLSRDYKRAYDNDEGPNTGGMGAYAPLTERHDDFLITMAHTIIRPVVDTLRARGTPYRGCIYTGLMECPDGIRVLEFNARFGDPELQVVLPLLSEDAVELMGACAVGGLVPGIASHHHGFAVGVVVASAGYPGHVETGAEIRGISRLDRHALCFHAGTTMDRDGTLRTNAGRVLTIVGRGHTLEDAHRHAYDNVSRIKFAGMQYRRDIAIPRDALHPA